MDKSNTTGTIIHKSFEKALNPKDQNPSTSKFSIAKLWPYAAFLLAVAILAYLMR